jgi:curved DNA-binding protein CbpA
MRRSVSGVAEPGQRGDPFAVLGLPARPGLSDEDVRSAWRRIAAATHPDREDGGDPAVFGAAAAAYVTLRTDFGRGEALADLHDPVVTRSARRPGRHRGGRERGERGYRERERGEHGPVRRGRAGRGSVMPGFRFGASLAGSGARLAAGSIRLAAAGAAVAAAFLAAGWSPGTAGVLAGALSWLVIAGLRS